jgi:hypothetical protein
MTTPAKSQNSLWVPNPNPKLFPRIQSGRCPQESLTVSARFRRTPCAAIMSHVAGSYTFTGVVQAVV